MEILQIALIVLAVAGIWAVVELALSIRRMRGTMDEVDRTMGELNEAVAEARPVVSKLDGALDELQPAIKRVGPLLDSTNVAVDALSANLVEVEAVVRDVSSLTGAAASAGSAVSDVAGSASEAVQKLIGRVSGVAQQRALDGAGSAPAEEPAPAADDGIAPAPDQTEAPAAASCTQSRYYTYGSEAAPAAGADSTEATDE